MHSSLASHTGELASRGRLDIRAFSLARIFGPIIASTICTLIALAGSTGTAALTTAAYSAAMAFGLAKVTERRIAPVIDYLLYVCLAILSLVMLALVIVPQDAKLYRLNFSGASSSTDYMYSYLCLVWVISLATVPLQFRRPSKFKSPSAATRFNKGTAITLAGLGAIGLVVSLATPRSEVFASRGTTSSAGLQSLLYWSATCFVSYCVLHCTSKISTHRWLLVTSALYTAALAATGNRTPLAFVGVAVVVRAAMDGRQLLLRWGVLAAPIGVGLAAYQSVWRGLLAAGQPSSPLDVVSIIASDPTQQFLRTGFDSIEGNFLAQALLTGGFAPRYGDPLLAILNFVPRQVWADKPTLFGSEVGRDYLGLTAGGIFLSGPGYLTLVLGSVILGLCAYLLFIHFLKGIGAHSRLDPLLSTALAYLAVRFTMAGDALDIFFALQVFVIFGVATVAGKLVHRP